MINSWQYQKLLQHAEWQIRRQRELQRAGNKCECCGKPDGLQCHHLDYLYTYNPTAPKESRFSLIMPWEYPDGWIEVLCDDCHKWRERFNKRGGQRTRVSTLACQKAVAKAEREALAEEPELLEYDLLDGRYTWRPIDPVIVRRLVAVLLASKDKVAQRCGEELQKLNTGVVTFETIERAADIAFYSMSEFHAACKLLKRYYEVVKQHETSRP